MMRLLIISDAHLITKDGKKAAYAPYVKELNLWMKYAGKTTIISPSKIDQPLLTHYLALQEFKHDSVTRLEFHRWSYVMRSLLLAPFHFLLLINLMITADHIHLRAPGNLTLLACIAQIFFPLKKKTAKYAGNWDPQASQPLSYRLQKWILSNTKLTRNMKVMAYGEWPNQTKNIEPFFTATYGENHKGYFEKQLKKPLQFLFVGTLSQNKNPQLLLELVDGLKKIGIQSQAHFYGDGPMLQELKEQCRPYSVKDEMGNEKDLKIIDAVFHGNQPADVVKRAYEESHFVFLASISEGWPKAVAEGMWYGCVPIATPVSCVPWMLNTSSNPDNDILGQHQRGIQFDTLQTTIEAIQYLQQEPASYSRMSLHAQQWSQKYTLEKFDKAIYNLLYS